MVSNSLDSILPQCTGYGWKTNQYHMINLTEMTVQLVSRWDPLGTPAITKF